jgi:quercetin dioxygenase-like cupin family protein
MRKRLMVLAAIAIAGVVLAGVGVAIATPFFGITPENARGDIATPLKLKEEFANGGTVKVKVTGPMEFFVQRLEAAPGASFGWHSHPGENINVVKQGTLTLYHDENCTSGISYGPGAVFTTSPDEIHLARNLSETETVVLFATYFLPKTTPPQAIRIDQPSPGPGCPQ